VDIIASAAMETKPTEQADVVQSSSQQQDAQQQSQQPTSVCLCLWLDVGMELPYSIY